MKTHEQILTMLAGNSSQHPMQFNALLTISGLQPDTLNMVLDQMYAAHHINQATVTRSGVEQREVWPTGMVKQLNTYADPSKRVAPTPLPRRNETPAIQLKEVTMNINHDEKTPKALTILKYIEANPVCNSAQIGHATGIVAPRSYIKAHISRGAVIVMGENRNDMKMQLAAGQTAEAIYGTGYNKAKPAPSAALLAEVQAAHANVYLPVGRVGFQPHAEPCSVGNELPTLPLLELADAEPAPTYEIPAFLRKSEEQQPVEPAPVVKFDTDLGFYKDEAVTIDELTAQVGRVGFQPHAEPCSVGNELPTLPPLELAEPLPAVKYDTDLGFYSTELITSPPTIQDHIDALFMLLPESATICITRNNAQLEIDIEAEVFGRSVCKSVSMHQVKETLDALHIVTVEMA